MTNVERMRLPRVPSKRFNITPYYNTDTPSRGSRIKHPHCPVIASRQQYRGFHWIPLNTLDLIFVDLIEAPYGTAFPSFS